MKKKKPKTRIKAMVWVVPEIDGNNCQCCLARLGKTTEEIKAMLESGELDILECAAVVPPGHDGCKCLLGPIASTSDVEGPDWKSFGKWLDSK